MQMNSSWASRWGVIFSLVSSSAALSFSALAEETFQPETLSVEKQIRPGPHLFVYDQGWSVPSRISVLSADDLSNKGNMSIGLVGQVALSKDEKTLYTTSAYAKRMNSGPIESVLQEYDVATLTPRREIILPIKTAQTAPSNAMLALSADGAYAFVQNATPATSVTVVSLSAGTVTAEIPTPGCFGIYPGLTQTKFSTLCGDGTLLSFVIKDDKVTTQQKSGKFFDADKMPVYITGLRIDKDLVFLSFTGEIIRVSDEKDKAKLVKSFKFNEGIPGEWGPGGAGVMAYNAPNNVLYVAMHADAADGSHKDPATEVWGIELKKQTLVVRSSIDEAMAIGVTQEKLPVLYASSEVGQVTRYESNPNLSLRKAGEVSDVGEFVMQLIVSKGL